jgi:hypothetical protein
MSRWVFLLGIGIAVLALAFVVTDCVIGPTPGVTEANVRRIKPGMTWSEVNATFGASGELSLLNLLLRHDDSAIIYRWEGPNGVAIARFGNGIERPKIVEFISFRRTPGPNILSRLRSWLCW